MAHLDILKKYQLIEFKNTACMELNDLNFRGENEDAVRSADNKCKYESDAAVVLEDTRSPLYNDMALVFATAPDFVSYRNTEHGSIFIMRVCKVFKKYAHQLDLHSMLNLVSIYNN